MNIPEIRAALDAAGAETLDRRACMLDIKRSTCFAIFSDSSRKARGISARILSRMLRSPHLPAGARAAVVQYARRKADNLAGRNRKVFMKKISGDLQAANDNN
jgi:ribonuclease HI